MTEDQSTPKRRKRLSPQDRWTIYQEAAAKDTKVGDVLRRWGIDSSQLARIREQVRTGALTELAKGPGRKPKDQEKEQLRQDLARLEEAFKEVSIENTLLRKKSGWA
ncbi:MAG: transposase [Actinomycetota bacterium]